MVLTSRSTPAVVPSCLFLLFLLLVAVTAPYSAEAFSFVPSKTVRPYSPLKLHPKQAADLEACAYDLMKAAAETNDESRAREAKHSPDQQRGAATAGPISWCRRVLFSRPMTSAERH